MKYSGAMKQVTERLHIDEPSSYCIAVQGHLDAAHVDWLEGLRVDLTHDANQQPVTLLIGELLDQAALIGVLRSLYNLHFPVVYIQWLNWNSDFITNHLTSQGERFNEDA